MIHRPSVKRSYWIGLLVLLSLLGGIVAQRSGGAPAALAGGAGTAARADIPEDSEDVVPGAPAAWDVVDAASGASGPDAGPAIAAASDCLGWPTRRIRYTSDGVIHLEGCGQTFTLTDVAAAPSVDTSMLELVDPANKIWLLKVDLKVEEGATLDVSGGPQGDANWLRLRSEASGGLWLRAENGNLVFRNTKVTSWDPSRNSVDTDPSVATDGTGGRSYIAVRSVLTKGRQTAPPTPCSVSGGSQEPYEGRMDVIGSELAYLGYSAPESYGVTWKVYYKRNSSDPNDTPPPGRQLYAMVDVFGTVSGSTFHHNYFGSFTYGGYCMGWTGNTFAENVQYGLDPHDDSDYLTITGNTFRDNGNHGVICSVECNNLVIANNRSYGNQHGIMIHRQVNGALIEGNASYNNRGAGIAIFDSHDAVVRNNTVTNNGESAVRLSVGSSRNLIENNTLTGLAESGVGPGYAIYTYKGSDLPASGDGLPKNNIFRNNRIAGYKHPLMKIGEATNNLFAGNTIEGDVTDIMFRLATGNIVRDSQIGKTLTFQLDSTSKVTLEDSRNNVWLSAGGDLSTFAEPGRSRLELTHANTGGSAAITTLDLSVRPQHGVVEVRPTGWATTRSWTVRPGATSGAVAHVVGGLEAGTCYRVTADNLEIGQFRADGEGRVRFVYTDGDGGVVSFAVAQVTGCAGPAPEPHYDIFLPLLAR